MAATVHPSGWFSYTSKASNTDRPECTDYNNCTMLVDIDQDTLARTGGDMAVTLVASYEQSWVARGTRLAVVTELAEHLLYGWSEDDRMLMDAFYV